MLQDKKFPEWALGLNLLLLGRPGAGKTTALATLAKIGLDVFIVFTEANGPNNLLKAMRELKLTDEEMARIHFMYIKSTATQFKVLEDTASKIQTASEFGKIAGGSRKDYGQLRDLMAQCRNFVDQHGKDWGSVDSWGPDRVLCLDSLSGLNDMAMAITIGGKPCATQQDWQVAMKQEMDFVKACINSQCHFIMTGHLAQERDEVSGRIQITAMALGQKNGPAMEPLFGDIVLAEKNGTTFTWSTTNSRIESLKNTYLPLSDKIKPTFVQVFEEWAKGY